MLGTNLILEDEERITCEVYELVRHLDEKYPFYHEHAKIYTDVIKAAKNFPGDRKKTYYRKLAEIIGDNAKLDLDFQTKIKNEKIKGSDMELKLMHLLGMLAMENGRTH